MDTKGFFRAILLLLRLHVCLSGAQDLELLDSKGRINGSTFVVGFPAQFARQSSSTDSVRLYITADRYAESFIQIPAINKNQSVALRPGGTMAVDLPGTVRMSRITGTEKKGIWIWTNSSVSVYGMNFADQSSDGFLALPLSFIGNHYMVITYTPIMHAVVMVIAALHGTEVTFILKLSGSGSVTVDGKQYRNGDSFKVLLDGHDSFQLMADSSAGSLSGTQLISNKAVSVYSGNDCADVPVLKGGCDHLVEQIPPLSTWGRTFLVKATAQRTGGDLFVILASQNQTRIEILNVNGSPLVRTIDAGKVYEFDAAFNSSHVIKTSKPSLVVQYGKSHIVDNSNFAPFMSIIPSIDHFSNDYTLVVPDIRSKSFKCFANIFVETRELKNIEIKATNLVDKLLWKRIPSSIYSTATVGLVRGQYRFYHKSPLKNFSMIFYGYGDYEAFGYPAGLRVYRPSRACRNTVTSPADGIDNDCDGKVDEELFNGEDDDEDGRIDEDLVTLIPEIQAPSVVNETDCSLPDRSILPSSPSPVYKANGMCAVRGNLNIVYTDKKGITKGCLEQKDREWTLTDGCQNKITVKQTVYVFTPNPLSVSFPSNKVFNCSYVPNDRGYGVPVVMSDCAGNVTMRYEDSTWGVIRDCGYLKPITVTRTWTVTSICGVKNSGSQKLSFINTAMRPFIVELPSKVSSATDTNITLPCTTQGNPKPVNTWILPNGNYVNKSQTIEDIEMFDDLSQRKRLKVLQDDGSLLITETRVRDSGVYRCVAKNIKGSVSGDVNLTIHDDLVDVDASVTIKDYVFDEALNDKKSEMYRTMEQHMKTNLTKVFEDMAGFQEVQILGFRNGSVKVIFRVVVKKKNKDEDTSVVVQRVGERLITKVKTGQLGSYKIVPTAELREKPPPPQQLQASEIKHSTVHLDWDPPDLHHMFSVSGYLIQYKTFGDKMNWKSFATVQTDNHRIDGLDSGTSYLIRMKSKNKYGHSQPSPSLEVTTLKGLTSAELALIIVVPILVLVIIIVILLIAWRRKRKHHSGFIRAGLEDNNGVVRYSRPAEKIVIDGTFTWTEIPRDRLELGRVLGEGEFGMVIEGKLTEEDGSTRRCAVKKLKRVSSESDMKDLLNELEIMVQVGHHTNIVNLIGACAKGDGPLLVVVEFASNGSLLRYLQKQSSRSYEDMTEYVVHIPPAERLKIACDIANGMAHLARRRCIHRDLAARNVLLDKNWTAKVSDFGLSRDVYSSAVYEKTTGGKLPAKWMAIEALEAGLNTTQSDIWSFGVVLWEIETGGCIPYPAFSVMEMLSALKQGYRLEKPASCPIELYNIMLKCWEANPSLRPSFDDLYIELHCLKESMSNFSSSYYENMEGGFLAGETYA